MNDDHVIDLLRAAGTSGTAGDLGPAMRQGNRIRRRRRIAQAAGGGAGVAAVVALGLMIGSVGGGTTDVVAAGDPKPAGGASSEKPAGGASSETVKPPKFTGPGADVRNNEQLLLDRLGSEWRLGTGDMRRFVVLDPNSASAQELPPTYKVYAELLVGGTGGERMLADACKPMVEKGLRVEECTPYQLPDGTAAYLQESHVVPGEYDPPAPRKGIKFSSDSLSVLVDRADDTWVRVRLQVRDSREVTPKADQPKGAEWLQDWADDLGKIAVDPEISPTVVTQTGAEAPVGPTRHEIYQGYLQEALGSSFSLIDGKVVLEPGSQKYSELPFTASSVVGELEFIRKNQFEAACQAKPGLEACI